MRYVLIDRILELQPERSATAVKTFSGDEDFLADHFPGMPVIPGALLIEAMSQTAGWLVARSIGFQRWPLLNMVGNAKFRSLVRPGQEISLGAEIESLGSDVADVRAEARVQGRKVAEARLFFHLFDFEVVPPMEAWSRETFQRLMFPTGVTP